MSCIKDKKKWKKKQKNFATFLPYKPTYYWLDVEEKTMKDMNAGVEARAKLQALGAKILDSISEPTSWKNTVSPLINLRLLIPTYGFDDGYYNAAPDTNTEYDLHQYTLRAIK